MWFMEFIGSTAMSIIAIAVAIKALAVIIKTVNIGFERLNKFIKDKLGG